jgi:TP901 family phage tail tape measure protein
VAADDVNIKIGADVSEFLDAVDKSRKASGKLISDFAAITKAAEIAGTSYDELARDISEAQQRIQTGNVGDRLLKAQIKADAQARQEADKQAKYLQNLRSNSAVVNQKIAEQQSAAERKEITSNNALMNKYEQERTQRATKRADELVKIEEAKNARILDTAQFLNKSRNDQEQTARQNELASLRASILGREQERQSVQDLINTLPRLRYALYDVASGFQQTSQVLLGFGKAVVTTAMDYETAFTNVERVTDLNVNQTARLRQELKDLGTQIPLTFQEITSVATLGAQLGIAERDLTQFTETVSKFSAVTNISNEEAAKSFGALGELLGFGADQYNNFGSAVAFAGIQAVATESEILSVATQIGGVAGAAGFSAESVVGLATALASLRIPAEQSRGALTRVFQEINRAGATGGPALQNFANILGITAEEAGNLARTDMSGFFDMFLEGLSGMDTQQLTASLDALGLSELRVTNTLTRLSSNLNVLRESQANATQGFQEGTFLSEAFGKRADDLASRLQILVNSLQNLADSVGQQVSPYLVDLIDNITNVIIGLNLFAESEVGGQILGMATAVAILVGGLFALFSALAIGAGGVLALVTAVAAFKGVATGAAGGFAQIISGLTGVTISAGAATAALTAVRIALIATGIGIAIAAVGAIAAGVAGAADASNKAAKGTSNWSEKVSKAEQNAAKLKVQTGDLNTEFNEMGSGPGGGSAGRAAEKIRTLGDYASDLSAVFSRAFEIRFSSGTALDAITKSFQKIAKATSDAREEIAELNADIQSLQADQALQEYFLSVAEAYGDTLKAQEIRANLAKIDADLTKKTQSLQQAQDKTNKTLIGNSEAAIDNRGEINSLVKQYQDYVKALANSGLNQEELRTKTAQLKADFIAQATQLGYNQTELGLYAAAFDDVTFAIDNIPRNITIDMNINPAVTALEELLAKTQETAGGMGAAFQNAGNEAAKAEEATRQARIEAVKYEDRIKSLGSTFQKFAPPAVKNYSFGPGSYTFTPRGGQNFTYQADGGYISGPGGPRDDRIPAMLSNGEYVVRAAAVSQYGVGFFDQLNQMKTPAYFTGGQVGTSTSSVVSLSPEDRAILRNAGGSGNVVLYADGKELARAVNDGNRQIVAQGGRP